MFHSNGLGLCILVCVSRCDRNEGTFGFYKGMSANLLRVAPASALTLVVYEKTKVAFTTLLE